MCCWLKLYVSACVVVLRAGLTDVLAMAGLERDPHFKVALHVQLVRGIHAGSADVKHRTEE